MSENGKLGSALSILKNEMVGSFCFTFVSDDNAVYAARDPKGFRPMVIGYRKDNNSYIVASESVGTFGSGGTACQGCKTWRTNKNQQLQDWSPRCSLKKKNRLIVLLSLPILHIHQV